MLHALTWEHFGYSILFLLVIYYGLLGFRYGVSSVKSLPLSGSPDSVIGVLSNLSSPEPSPKAAQSPPAGIMGKAKLPEGISIVETSELKFHATSRDGSNDQLGLIPDLQEDLKQVFKELGEEDGQKGDFLKKMAEIRELYPDMATHPQLQAINGFIAQNAPFFLSKADFELLWD